MTDPRQRYISSELTHFVGRRLQPDEDAQYGLLRAILQEGCLMKKGAISERYPGLEMHPHEKFSENEMFDPNVVCFCDIPLGDLHIHTNKYGRFGVAFDKDFVVHRGGVPVYYVPRGAIDTRMPPEAPCTKQEKFDTMVPQWLHLVSRLTSSLPHEAVHTELVPEDELSFVRRDPEADLSHLLEKYPNAVYAVEQFFMTDVLSYIKFFDHDLLDDDKSNFYFEREWRVLGRLDFDITDVRRVLLSEGYAPQFRCDFPQYSGQMHFV